MAVRGYSFNCVNKVLDTIDNVRSGIANNQDFENDLRYQGEKYKELKKLFTHHIRVLRYRQTVEVESLYRVRKTEASEPFSKRDDLVYPSPDAKHEDRMNNMSFRVLYTSLNEHTAMAEARVDESLIGKHFQLTRFSIERPLSVYKLGLFSELYFNYPRDSDSYKNKMIELFQETGHDTTIRGYASLESALASILYDNRKGYYYISSILADAIFTEFSNVDAICYPTMQNRYGLNFALKQDVADSLKVEYTSLNELKSVHPNGFYEYITTHASVGCMSRNSYDFEELGGGDMYR